MKTAVWIFLALILYVLSSGPVTGLVADGYLPDATIYVYLPLVYLGLYIQPIGILLYKYVTLCGGVR